MLSLKVFVRINCRVIGWNFLRILELNKAMEHRLNCSLCFLTESIQPY